MADILHDTYEDTQELRHSCENCFWGNDCPDKREGDMITYCKGFTPMDDYTQLELDEKELQNYNKRKDNNIGYEISNN